MRSELCGGMRWEKLCTQCLLFHKSIFLIHASFFCIDISSLLMPNSYLLSSSAVCTELDQWMLQT